MIAQQLALADGKPALEEAGIVAAGEFARLAAGERISGDGLGMGNEAAGEKRPAGLLDAQNRERVAMRSCDDCLDIAGRRRWRGTFREGGARWLFQAPPPPDNVPRLWLPLAPPPFRSADLSPKGRGNWLRHANLSPKIRRDGCKLPRPFGERSAERSGGGVRGNVIVCKRLCTRPPMQSHQAGTFQISFAYSRMVRSDENQPICATLRMARAYQSGRSRQTSSTRRWVAA